MNLQLIYPDWPLRDKVTAFTTTRIGGKSLEKYHSFNPALHVGDIEHNVLANRSLLQKQLGSAAQIKWLKQTHSNIVVDAARIDSDIIEADASFTTSHNIACAVLTADCLPLLFSDKDGYCIAATHAGWRGLLNGVIENTIDAMSKQIKPDYVWLGPAIGPDAFEVGQEVYDSYLNRNSEFQSCFSARAAGKWTLDIYHAAKIVLQRAGISNVYGGSYCTYSDEHQFFSYRRDVITGRMATIIARR